MRKKPSSHLMPLQIYHNKSLYLKAITPTRIPKYQTHKNTLYRCTISHSMKKKLPRALPV